MMVSPEKLLVVDVGNTSTAIGLWQEGCVRHVRHCDADVGSSQRIVAELVASHPQVSALAYLSVVPAVDSAWKRFAKQELHLPFIAVNHTMFERYSGLLLDYPKPRTIGTDRLADAAAAVARYGLPLLVCDFGTCFTAAVVTPDRAWRGGVIAPGLPLMRDYLAERTAKLPRMKLGGRVPKIGRSTQEAMRFGALVGYRGMVREIVGQLQKNFDEQFQLVATGGFARLVLRDLDEPFDIDPNLTLDGCGLLVSKYLAGKRKLYLRKG